VQPKSIIVVAFVAFASAAAAQSFSHDDWSAVLAAHVDEQGLVSYSELASDRAVFDRYLAALSTTSPDSAPGLFPTDAERLAYWLNAYNAWTIQGVLARGAGLGSVWGEGLTGLGFFREKRVVLGGRKLSLQLLEDEIVRGRFHDPRVHAALNCASRSCPRLPRKAFEGSALDAELDAAMREFVAEPRNVSVDLDRRAVQLSKIFDWFEDDFLAFETRTDGGTPDLLGFVNRYRAPDAQIPPGLEIEFFDYDKRLNGR
jgi:hypothetical protein